MVYVQNMIYSEAVDHMEREGTSQGKAIIL